MPFSDKLPKQNNKTQVTTQTPQLSTYIGKWIFKFWEPLHLSTVTPLKILQTCFHFYENYGKFEFYIIKISIQKSCKYSEYLIYEHNLLKE